MSMPDINTVESNYRAEMALGGFIAGGCEEENAFIIRRKGNLRDISKDIDEIRRYADIVEIYSNRNGIYDALPEGVFHHSASSRKAKDKEQILHEISEQREEENAARNYFRPFEMMLDKVLAETQIYEQKYNKAHLYSHFSSIFREQWNILEYLTATQALLFIRLLPVMGEAAGSFELTAKVMAIILNCPVRIREWKKTEQILERRNSAKLGKWRLGINSVIGKTVMSDDRSLEISIGEISAEQMRLFETGANSDRILKHLIDLMIPFDRDTKIKYKVTGNEKKFRLSSTAHKTYLGINTTLK
ncbi:hypothetical protein FACS18945_4270 [Bacteroidia bacterium]|nr:hypothetical protein FACS18945_4270 [Bacteroidia bacterium]